MLAKMASYLPVDQAIKSFAEGRERQSFALLNKESFKKATSETFMKSLNFELHEANTALKAQLHDAYECKDF
jgi:hypothetical protein